MLSNFNWLNRELKNPLRVSLLPRFELHCPYCDSLLRCCERNSSGNEHSSCSDIPTALEICGIVKISSVNSDGRVVLDVFSPLWESDFDKDIKIDVCIVDSEGVFIESEEWNEKDRCENVVVNANGVNGFYVCVFIVEKESEKRLSVIKYCVCLK